MTKIMDAPLTEEEKMPVEASKCNCGEECMREDCEYEHYYSPRLLLHNELCEIIDDNIDDFEYVVSCKGTITAGIEVKNIKIKLDEENKKLTITVPEAKLNDKNILSRTFLNGEDLDADKLPEATKLCEDTLSEKVEKDEKLLPAAKEQAKVVLKSYYEQWLKALGEDYTIEMK